MKNLKFRNKYSEKKYKNERNYWYDFGRKYTNVFCIDMSPLGDEMLLIKGYISSYTNPNKDTRLSIWTEGKEDGYDYNGFEYFDCKNLYCKHFNTQQYKFMIPDDVALKDFLEYLDYHEIKYY